MNAETNQPSTLARDAFLGDKYGEVTEYQGAPLPEGYVVVRDPDGNLSVAFNQRVPIFPGAPIKVGYDPLQPTLFQVLAFRDYLFTTTAPAIPSHHRTHEWPGADTTYIRGEQFLPGLLIANQGMVISIYPLIFRNSTGLKTSMPYQTLDLTSYIPATGAQALTIVVNESGVVQVVPGLTRSSLAAIQLSDFGVTTDITLHELWGIRVYASQTVIAQTLTYTDVFDFRDGGASGGGLVYWDDIRDVPLVFPPDTAITKPLYAGRVIKLLDPTVTDDSSLGYQSLDLWLNQTINQVYVCLDSTPGAAIWLPLGNSMGNIFFGIEGVLAVTTEATLSYLITEDTTIESWYIYASDSGSSSATIVDLNRNGTSIFASTPGNRPTLNSGDPWAVSGVPDVIDFVQGDVISVDVDQIAPGSSDVVIIGLASRSGGGSSFNLTVTDGTTSVGHVGEIQVDGAVVEEVTGGVAKVTISPSPLVSLTTLQTRTQNSYTALTTGDGTAIIELDLTLTPLKLGNKIILEWVVNFEAMEDLVFTVLRNGSLLANSDDGGGHKWSGIAAVPYDHDLNSTPSNVTVKIIDESSLDVASTYSLAIKASGASAATFWLNRTSNNPGSQSYENMLSTGNAMEINT